MKFGLNLRKIHIHMDEYTYITRIICYIIRVYGVDMTNEIRYACLICPIVSSIYEHLRLESSILW